MLLKRARDLCEASEVMTDEEKAAELTPVLVQQVYALARLGKLDEAAALQKTVDALEYVYIVYIPVLSWRQPLSSPILPCSVRRYLATNTCCL